MSTDSEVWEAEWRRLWSSKLSFHALLELLLKGWHRQVQFHAAVRLNSRLVAVRKQDAKVADKALREFLDAKGERVLHWIFVDHSVRLSTSLGSSSMDILNLLQPITELSAVREAMRKYAEEKHDESCPRRVDKETGVQDVSCATAASSSLLLEGRPELKECEACRLPGRWCLHPCHPQSWEDEIYYMNRIPESELTWYDPRPYPDHAENDRDDWEYVEQRWQPLDDASQREDSHAGTVKWGGDPQRPWKLWGQNWEKRDVLIPTDHQVGALLLDCDVSVAIQNRKIFRLVEKRVLPHSRGVFATASSSDLRLGGLLHLVSTVLAVPATWDVELRTQFREGSSIRYLRTRVLSALLAGARASEEVEELPPDAGGLDDQSLHRERGIGMQGQAFRIERGVDMEERSEPLDEKNIGEAIRQLHCLLRQLILERDQIAEFSVSVNSIEGTLHARRGSHRMAGYSPQEEEEDHRSRGRRRAQGGDHDGFVDDGEGDSVDGSSCGESEYDDAYDGFVPDSDGYDDFNTMMDMFTYQNYWEDKLGGPLQHCELNMVARQFGLDRHPLVSDEYTCSSPHCERDWTVWCRAKMCSDCCRKSPHARECGAHWCQKEGCMAAPDLWCVRRMCASCCKQSQSESPAQCLPAPQSHALNEGEPVGEEEVGHYEAIQCEYHIADKVMVNSHSRSSEFPVASASQEQAVTEAA
ncbi:hypothetical protein CBR_g50243 [Chara braunii]|uniref:Uncharacterized protein n=1 Tax=Chara braunii TaxID=69332 RepID=A0A388M6N6_CHABU|nr:hypothetical protein CBR_g50243 [Chara braunii]|eukprot:GBG90149.1 hypothetical protein CBR_g50243 [Chara braunii]